MICKALHDSILFLVECNILVSTPSFLLTIIVNALQLYFHFCDLPGHMVRAKKSLMDIKKHIWIILYTLSLFHMYISIHVQKIFKRYCKS